MYVCIGVKDGAYRILDSSDKVAEWIPSSTVIELVKNRVKINGLTVESSDFISTVCNSTDAFEEFFKKVKITLAKLHLLQITDRTAKVNQIADLAKKYGFIDSKAEMAISIEDRTLIFVNLNRVLTWEDDCSYSTTQSVDVRSEECVKLSKLGTKAFDFMYLDIEGKRITMTELLNEVKKVSNDFKIDRIDYIGITPSNNMFKIKAWGDMYSVQFATVAKARTIQDKIIGTSVEKAYGFNSYVRESLRSDKYFMCIKATLKPSKFRDLYELKTKYKTLHDVYIRQ